MSKQRLTREALPLMNEHPSTCLLRRVRRLMIISAAENSARHGNNSGTVNETLIMDHKYAMHNAMCAGCECRLSRIGGLGTRPLSPFHPHPCSHLALAHTYITRA
jgi:hypothetical protein